ncbi:unnamed protein product [Phytophthora fragariaefolia]|uniref:Unnamed protein product n=1 Tax=Phytophthora fragariaefolia TaxID=1490495 RepID=A0A9W6Y7Z5_9STRA|nr:unnamed protein product [Phytophthora fragariaefolia]
MVPKISSVLGFHEREQLHKNPSILAYTGDVGQNYLDLGGAYGDPESEQDMPTQTLPRSRTSTEKERATTSSRLSLLSFRLRRARTAVATRAKRLHVRESTRQAINQLRKTIVKRPSARANQPTQPVPAAHQHSNQCDNDHFSSSHCSSDYFTDAGNAGFECMYAEVNLGTDKEFRHSSQDVAASKASRLSKLLPARPWMKSSKPKRRFSDELY